MGGTALEARFNFDQRDAAARDAIEPDFPATAIGDAHLVPIGPIGPTECAGPAGVALRSQRTRSPIQAAPSKLA
jgi:hypothetical protein